MSKPTLIKKVSSALVTVLLLSILMPILALAANYTYTNFDGKNVSGSVYTSTYNQNGVTLYAYGPNNDYLTTVFTTYAGFNVLDSTYKYDIIQKEVSTTLLSKVGLKELANENVTSVVYSGFVNQVTAITTDIPTTLTAGSTHNSVVMATYMEGAPLDVTANANYSSSNTSVISVVGAGQVNALAAGTSVITVTYGGKTATVNVTVTANGGGQQVSLTSIATNIPTSLTVGNTHNTVVTATYSDNTTRDVTAYANYSSSDTSVLSVVGAGQVNALAAGTSVITVTYGGKTATVNVTVTANGGGQQASLTSIATNIPTSLTVGNTHNTVVTATYSDNTTRDVTAYANYSSSDTSVLSVVGAGQVNALAAGSSVITVTYGGKTATVNVTVTAGSTGPDTTAPTWPTGAKLNATKVTTSSLTLEWPQATDSSSVTYHVYNGNVLMGKSGALTYSVTGLSSNTLYSFRVLAFDAYGNMSEELKTSATTTAGSSSGPSFGGGGGGFPSNTTNSDGSINVTNGQVDSSTLKNAFANKTEATLVVKGDTVTIPVSALTDAAKKSGSTLVIKTDNGTYVLPLSLFDFDALAKDLGVAVGDLKFTVNIKKLAGNDAKAVTDGVTAAGGTSISEAVDFSITFEGKDGKKTTLDSFKQYVKRTIPLKSKPGKNAVVLMYDPATKTFSFVPSTVSDTEATFSRPGNSVYTVVEYSKTFSDIATHWAKADIELLASKMIVNGATDTAFQADRNITRAEFAALVVRSLGLTPVASAAKFSDVKSADWYAGAVGAAVQAGIVNGYEDGSFRPQAQISREELAAMVVRAYEFAGGKVAIDQAAITKALSKFSDAGKIVWGQKEVAIALSAGLMNGMTDTTLVTNGQATRAEAATMLKRFLSNLKFI